MQRIQQQKANKTKQCKKNPQKTPTQNKTEQLFSLCTVPCQHQLFLKDWHRPPLPPPLLPTSLTSSWRTKKREQQKKNSCKKNAFSLNSSSACGASVSLYSCISCSTVILLCKDIVCVCVCGCVCVCVCVSVAWAWLKGISCDKCLIPNKCVWYAADWCDRCMDAVVNHFFD